ncbi:MAG TPA: VOC family protein [Bryobacteraceae bacterium]|nr:VOC family protein [Bryobacteraceae bacterium]
MRRLMSSIGLFAAGMAAGIVMMQPGAAQNGREPGMRLNHVGVYAKDFDESLRFYTQTMGFHQAFSIPGKDGKTALTYLQINKDTFLELAPTPAGRQPGLSHVGIWPDNLDATVAALRGHGEKVADARAGSTKSRITNVMDPNGVRLELVDFPPGSLPRNAIDNWK